MNDFVSYSFSVGSYGFFLKGSAAIKYLAFLL